MPHEDRGILGGLVDRVIGPPARIKEAHRQQQAQAELQAEREGSALGLIRSVPELGAAFAGDAAQTPAAQGIFAGLASEDPVARNNALVAADAITGRTAAAQQAKAERKLAQREALTFQLDTQKQLLDLELLGYNVKAARRTAQTGFASDNERFEISSRVQSLNNTLGSIENVQSIRRSKGILGPIDRFTSPESFAALEQFMFDKIVLFKTLADDSRVSDDDRDFYRSIGDVSAISRLFNGGQIEASFLEELHRRLSATQGLYKFVYPSLARDNPSLFTRPFRGDIGPTVDPQGPADETIDSIMQQVGSGLSFGLPVGGQF